MKKNKGFTLIELLVTIVIVSTLSMVAITTYQSQMLKSRRADAKSKLMEVMQREERYFNENNGYTTTFTQMGYASPLNSDNNYYVITGAAGPTGLGDNIILTATPQGSQLNDTSCGNFILNSNGQKSITGSGTNCW